MLFCNQYIQERDLLFKQIMLVKKDFMSLSHTAMFEYMMTSEDDHAIKSVMEYIYLGLNRRKRILGKK